MIIANIILSSILGLFPLSHTLVPASIDAALYQTSSNYCIIRGIEYLDIHDNLSFEFEEDFFDHNAANYEPEFYDKNEVIQNKDEIVIDKNEVVQENNFFDKNKRLSTPSKDTIQFAKSKDRNATVIIVATNLKDSCLEKDNIINANSYRRCLQVKRYYKLKGANSKDYKCRERLKSHMIHRWGQTQILVAAGK